MITRAPLLDRVLEPMMTVEAARQLVEFRADEATKTRLNELAERSTEGLLTAEETEEYDGYVIALDVLALLQAKARQVLADQSA